MLSLLSQNSPRSDLVMQPGVQLEHRPTRQRLTPQLPVIPAEGRAITVRVAVARIRPHVESCIDQKCGGHRPRVGLRSTGSGARTTDSMASRLYELERGVAEG